MYITVTVYRDEGRTDLVSKYSAIVLERTRRNMDMNSLRWTQERYATMTAPANIELEEGHLVTVPGIGAAPDRVWDVDTVESRWPRTIATLTGAR